MNETNETKYLITGATGATGGVAARELLAKGYNVRVFVRKQDERSKALEALGAEIAYGDLLDFGSVRQALKDIQRAYFVYPIRAGLVQATAGFAQAAKESGVEAIVNMSQISARGDAKSEAATMHWLGQQVFDWSGVPVTHLQPTFFSEWLLYIAPFIRQDKFFVPFASGKHAPIAAEDQGRVIAAILQDPAPHAGKSYPLFGPVEYTWQEIAGIVATTLGRQIEYRKVSFDEFGDLLMSAGPKKARTEAGVGLVTITDAMREEYKVLLQHLREVTIDHDNGIFSGTNEIVQTLTGREPLTVEEFVEKHRSAFEPEGIK